MEKIRNTAILMVLGLSIVLASNGDYEQEKKDNDHYCQMTQNGLWPSYNSSIEC